MRLEQGNFSWGSKGIAKKTRIIDVVYNASNNELVRTKTLVKNAIVLVDGTPFRAWYESHFLLPLGRRGKAKVDTSKTDAAGKAVSEVGAATGTLADDVLTKKRGKKTMKKYLGRQKDSKVEQPVEEQFGAGRVLACISSRPGQVGCADGYLLEGKELDFYSRKLKTKKKT